MINSAETIQPSSAYYDRINPAETIPPGGDIKIKKLLPGDTIAEDYTIDSLLNDKGKQSYIYLAQSSGKLYVVKHYHSGTRIAERLQKIISGIRHPNVAQIIDYGKHDNVEYEIYDYFAEGTVEDEKQLNSRFIEKVFVPAVNEGLYALHKNGVVHCDLKPGNLFFVKDKSSVVIGDFGVSGLMDAGGKFFGHIRGTPEYSPSVKTSSGYAAYSAAYDYGSFAFVLYRVIVGESFFAGMSIEEITRARENGLELPSSINGRLRDLLEGLLIEDESKRWGYDEVKRWCEYDYVSTARKRIPKRKKEKEIEAFIVGRINGEMVAVHSLHQLAIKIKESWQQTRPIVKRRELSEFIYQFEPELALKVRELEKYHDEDAALFKLLCYIDEGNRDIFYAGNAYQSLSTYCERLLSGKDEDAKQFLASGLLVFYLRENGYDPILVDKLEKTIKRVGCEDTAAITTICYALNKNKTFRLKGYDIENLDELIQAISKCSVSEINQLLEDSLFIAWMNRLGFEKEMKIMLEGLF